MLQLRDVTKRYGSNWAVRGVSCELSPGQVYGLIGVNGSGKSTIMKIIAGAERATSGQLLVDGNAQVLRGIGHAARLGIGMVPQELSLVRTVSVAENVFLGRLHTRLGTLRPTKLHRATEEVLAELGVSIDPRALAGELPLAEQQMVVIARTLSRRARLVLLDEPTSALAGADVARLRHVVRDLAAQGRTVVLVSQRLDDIFAVADHVLVLRNGGLVSSGPVSELTPNEAVGLMLHGRADVPTTPAGQDAVASESVSRPTALEVDSFRTAGLAEPLTLNVGAGEIVGLAGLPGSGPTEFMRGLFGLRAASVNELRIFGKAHRLAKPAKNIDRGLAYVTGDRQAEGLIPDASVADNIATVRNRSARIGPRRLIGNSREALAQMRELKIRPGDPDVAVRQLSGGNQQKVIFARWLLTSPRLWLLDDATRGVDIGARRDIHDAVRRSARQDGGAALVVSSDVLELFEVCDRIVVFRSGRVVVDVATELTTPAAVEALAAGTEVTAA